MKKILLALLIIILFLAFVAHYNNNPRIIISNLLKKGIINSDELKYKIYLFGVLPVAEASFIFGKIEEYGASKVYHLNASAQTLNYIHNIFKGSAILDSYVDTREFNPVFFKQQLTKGDKKINREVFYDQKNGVMSIDNVRRQIFADTQDPLSAIFYLKKRIDFSKTKEIEMSINSNQKNYILKGIANPKDIAINKEAHKAVFLKAEISRRDKNPYHKSKVDMVLLNKGQNIPVLIKVFAGGILINAKLTDIK